MRLVFFFIGFQCKPRRRFPPRLRGADAAFHRVFSTLARLAVKLHGLKQRASREADSEEQSAGEGANHDPHPRCLALLCCA
jgi:hypothetical protein